MTKAERERTDEATSQGKLKAVRQPAEMEKIKPSKEGITPQTQLNCALHNCCNML